MVVHVQRMCGISLAKTRSPGNRDVTSASEYFINNHQKLLLMSRHNRKLKADGHNVPFHEYTTKSTDSYRHHLAKHHLKPWIEACLALKIPLTSVAAKEALQEYHKQFPESTRPSFTRAADAATDLSHQVFTKEAFVDALMIWIVADDQVSHLASICATNSGSLIFIVY